MTTKVELENALKNAMRSGDELRKSTIRMALSSIRLTEIDKGLELDEPAIMAILQKEVKSLEESIADAERAGRPEEIQKARAEISILGTFLPQPFSPAELEAMVREAIQETGASSPADMGKVMKLLTPRLQGRATGSQASQMVRQLLQS